VDKIIYISTPYILVVWNGKKYELFVVVNV